MNSQPINDQLILDIVQKLIGAKRVHSLRIIADFNDKSTTNSEVKIINTETSTNNNIRRQEQEPTASKNLILATPIDLRLSTSELELLEIITSELLGEEEIADK